LREPHGLGYGNPGNGIVNCSGTGVASDASLGQKDDIGRARELKRIPPERGLWLAALFSSVYYLLTFTPVPPEVLGGFNDAIHASGSATIVDLFCKNRALCFIASAPTLLKPWEAGRGWRKFWLLPDIGPLVAIPLFGIVATLIVGQLIRCGIR
jgi:hypothetical protein